MLKSECSHYHLPKPKPKLEVLIEKGSASVSCDANRTKTVCRKVEHMNSFYLSQ